MHYRGYLFFISMILMMNFINETSIMYLYIEVTILFSRFKI